MAITVEFDPPLITDSLNTFNTKAFDTFGKLNSWSTEANGLAEDANDAADAAVSAASTSTTKAGEASGSAAAAAAAKTAAEDARDAAQGYAASINPSQFAPKASPELTGDIYANGRTRGKVSAVGAGATLDCSAANYFTKSMSSNWTPTISNVPSGAFGFVLELAYTSGALTLPGGWKWSGGTAPTLSSGTWIIAWMTSNGGTDGIVVAHKRGA